MKANPEPFTGRDLLFGIEQLNPDLGIYSEFVMLRFAFHGYSNIVRSIILSL